MTDDNEEITANKNYEAIKLYKTGEVISTMNCATVIENLFGIFRFSFVDGELLRANIKMKIFAILMPVLVVTLYVFFTQQSYPQDNLITIMDLFLSSMALIHYTMSAIITTFLLSRTCVHILKEFANLDAMLYVQTTEEFYKDCRRETIKYLTLLATFHIVSCSLDFANDKAPIPAKLIIVILYFLENLEILIFCKFIAMLKRRLHIITGYLATFIQGKHGTSVSKCVIFTMCGTRVAPEDNFNWIGYASVHNMKIRDLATMYDMIGTICSLINEVSNLQIFMTLVSTFSYILIAIWSTIYFFRATEYTYQWLITIVAWCFTSISTVAVMCIACERLLSERNRTKVLVNQIIMDYDLPKTMRVQAKAFMELIEAWPLRVYIYDMFSVDITLMLKFISVATTYLIVIIQISHFV